ncbi:MAG TPA: ATP-binding protein, partial [Roseateles sp.]|nr:ATP-binding protein [Roseateles sp.]
MPLLLGPERAKASRHAAGLMFLLALPALLPVAAQAGLGLPLAAALALALALSLLAQAYWRRLALRLERAERRWHLLADQLDQMVWVSQPGQSGLTVLSSAAERVCGRAAGELQAEPRAWLELVHPEDRAGVEACWPLRPGSTRRIEYRIRHRDGGWRWVRDRATELQDERGALLGRAGIVEDITRQREAELRLQARQQQLLGLVETAMDAVITVDVRQRIVQFNRAAAAVFRLPQRKALGQRLDRFLPDARRHAELVAGFAASGQSARRMGARHVLTGLRADGEAFPFEASISRFGEGEQQLMTVVLRDVSEAHAMDAARRAQELAEAASRAKTDFLSRMSHELRTPLNAVLGFAQLLRAGHELPEAQGQQLAQIERAGWHLAELIDDVLDVSRIEAGRVAVSLGSVSARTALAEALQLSLPAAQQRGLRVHAPFGEAPDLRLRADPVRLRQVLLNLLSNATKYNRAEGELRLSLRAEAGQALIEITDTGIGMSEQQLAHLFEPFNRLGREHSGIQGTGIGLVLSRQLMALMQGALEVDS